MWKRVYKVHNSTAKLIIDRYSVRNTAIVLKFSGQFVKYNAIERSSEINVNNIDIATASRGNSPIMG